ncbi:MAG: hypothetical protein RMM06_11995, partial [Armatimonadota bacterium]|nr:hypothetical protein [Armatimonadota bacterium]
RELERAARQASLPQREVSSPAVSRETSEADPHVLALEDRLRSTLATKVKIHCVNGKGVIEIHFFDTGELDRIVETIAAVAR